MARLSRLIGTVGACVATAACGGGAGTDYAPRSVIVDQLSLTVPNETFVHSATAVLGDAGQQVDYVAGHDATVELFKTLPRYCYEYVVLRVHSARLEVDSGRALDDRTAGAPAYDGKSDDVAIFTGELIDPRIYDLIDIVDGAATAVAAELDETVVGARPASERRHGADELARLVPATHSIHGVELPLFALTPEYVRLHFDDDFPCAPTVVMMGCDGLRSESMARAFVERGARSYISWDGPVQASQSDLATLRLLHDMLAVGLDAREAVAETMTALGPDRFTGARLGHYP